MSEKAEVSSVSPSLDRSDEGLTLETSAFSLYGDQLTFSTQLFTLNYPLYSPTDAAPQFSLKLTSFTDKRQTESPWCLS